MCLALPVLAAPTPDPDPALPHIETRHGSVTMPEQLIAVEGGFTTVFQAALDKHVLPELVASFDLVTALPAGRGKWVIYIEGNTSPREGGVSSLLPEANTDAGTALDRDRNGRLQVSELHYFYPIGNNALLVTGLLDLTSTLDSSEVANDETAQFLSGPLVNNPTIDFPDYSLGMVYNRETGVDRGYSLALTSSHGLADNANASYAQLVDIGADGRGVFAAGEVQWPAVGSKLHAGIWLNSAGHAKLKGQAGTEHNYGVYLVADHPVASGWWSLRAGLANERTSPAGRFLSLALQQPLADAILGLGIAYTGLSGQDTSQHHDDMLQAECYLRFAMYDNISITPALQWLRNGSFDASGEPLAADQTLLSLRLNDTF